MREQIQVNETMEAKLNIVHMRQETIKVKREVTDTGAH